MFYQDVFSALGRAGVKYLVVGGLALNLYGIPRMTADLDLMLSLDKGNLEKLIAVLKELGYRPKVPVRLEDLLVEQNRESWRNEKNMVVFTVINPEVPYQEVDLFIHNPIDFETAYAGRETVSAGGIPITIPALEDLIALKQLAGREQDLSDIKALEQLKKMRGEEA